MDIAGIVEEIAAEIAKDAAEIERTADAKAPDVPPGPFGIAVVTAGGEVFAGGSEASFPIQSISKALALDLALERLGERVFERVGREPSGDPFDSLVDLERTRGVPRNPFINAGALVVVDMLIGEAEDADGNALVDLVAARLDHPATLDPEVLREGQDLNRAMLSFMRHHGNLHATNDAVMAAYLRQCAIVLDCAGLARVGLPLARTRLIGDAAADERALRTRRVLALMMTCGHYDASGDLALRVGLPAKSGVGGGILAIAPETASIAVWSPNLDQHGNSMLGVRGLEMLAARTGWSVFGPPVAQGPSRG